MSKTLPERLAEKAAANCIKSANFDIMQMLQQLFSQGGSMLQGMDLKSLMPYMPMLTPLFKGVGSVAGLPGVAGSLDLLRGGENIRTLTAGAFGGQQPQTSSGPGQPPPQSTPAPNNAPIQPNTPKPPVQPIKPAAPIKPSGNSFASAKVG